MGTGEPDFELRNIAQLEASLGVRLFDRVRTGYRITSDGEDVLASAHAMESQAEALQRRALGRQPNPAGRLKLSISKSGARCGSQHRRTVSFM